ncbi:DUF6660 family protein [Pseudopedobacter saltans]|nr:DUF6660 family protein [Pseudopedobacter saltans]
MRWIATIFLFYFTVLFAVPCSDAKNSCEDAKPIAKEQAHNHGGDHDDNCTPFCQCTCCSVSVDTFVFISHKFDIPVQLFSTKKTEIRDISFTSNYLDNIWQPPKSKA